MASNKSGNIEAIEFLLTLGGTWVTDCGCRTVTDLEQADVPDYFYEHAAGRYAVTAEDDLVTHVGPGAFDAITEALDHTCEASP